MKNRGECPESYLDQAEEKRMEAKYLCSADDCQQDKDRCPDCYEGNLYLSPDIIDIREDR
jgi:hypothetical protein